MQTERQKLIADKVSKLTKDQRQALRQLPVEMQQGAIDALAPLGKYKSSGDRMVTEMSRLNENLQRVAGNGHGKDTQVIMPDNAPVTQAILELGKMCLEIQKGQAALLVEVGKIANRRPVKWRLHKVGNDKIIEPEE